MKEKSKARYMFNDSKTLLKGKAISQWRKAEIIKTLHSRYGIAQPRNKVLYFIIAGIGLLILLASNFLFVVMLATVNRVDNVSIGVVLIAIGIVFGLSALIFFLVRDMWRVATTPQEFIENLYKELRSNGTIVDGEVYIVTHDNKYWHVIYTINGDARTYEFTTLAEGFADIGQQISILFLNEKAHIPL